MNRLMFFSIAATVLFASTAFAYSEPEPKPFQATAGKAEPEVKQTLDAKGHVRSVDDDRMLIMPTAQTKPKGAMSITDYELAILQFSYGILDNLQFSLTATVPVYQFGFAPSLKWKFFETSNVRLAAMVYGGFLMIRPDDRYNLSLGGNAHFELCFDKKCESTLNAAADFAGGWSFFKDYAATSNFAMSFAAGFLIRLVSTVKLVIEVDYGMLPIPSSNSSVFTVNYAIRIHGGEFSGDIGFLRPIFYTSDGEARLIENAFFRYMPLGIPWLSFTYQW